MRRLLITVGALLMVMFVFITSCTHKPQISTTVVTPDSGFPDAVGKIFTQQCATAGCHDAASYQNAAGLLLDSWTHLMQGSNFGAEVVAYSPNPAWSDLLGYCDTVITSTSHQPTPLTSAQYHTLVNWIASGAPDKNGNIPFASNPDTRQKIYLAISSDSNKIAVIDGASRLIMRYISVGDATNVAPHDVRVDNAGLYAYVSIYSGSYVQKIDTRTDSVIATANLRSDVSSIVGDWSILNMSPQDTEVMVTGWANPGYVVSIRTSDMTVNQRKSVDVISGGTSQFADPHGLCSNATYDTFFAALQFGNTINKFSFQPTSLYLKQIPIKGTTPTIADIAGAPSPHSLLMAPDFSKYFVTCSTSNEVRVIDAHTDVVLDSISVGTGPQEMAISVPRNLLFVTCWQDATNTYPGAVGSVYVIDITNMTVKTILYGYLKVPHGITVDEQDTALYVCNTNQGGTAHHSTGGGAPGWYTVYNLNTLQLADNKIYYTGNFAYTLSTRFK
jgi:YVTN family beta-propeller protein